MLTMFLLVVAFLTAVGLVFGLVFGLGTLLIAVCWKVLAVLLAIWVIVRLVKWVTHTTSKG